MSYNYDELGGGGGTWGSITGTLSDQSDLQAALDAKLNSPLTLTDIGFQIPASQIGDGSVDDTEFGFLNGLTENIQNAINEVWRADGNAGFIAGAKIFGNTSGTISIAGKINNVDWLRLGDSGGRELVDSLSSASIEFDARNLVQTGGFTVLDWENSLLRSRSGSNLKTMDWEHYTLFDNTEASSADWNLRVLYDPSGFTSVDWGVRQLFNAAASMRFDWDTGVLCDDNANEAINLSTRTLVDDAAAASIDFQNRLVIDGSSNTVLNYSVQQDSSISPASIATGSGAAILDDDTFDGYTLAQVVAALRAYGLLA